MELKVTFLGTGGTAPSADRGMPATLVVRGGEKFLFDCGEGTQRQLWRATGGLPDIDAIFLTHYHTDHILGLPGLLNSYQLRGRERPVPIYGPAPLEKNLKRFSRLMGPDTYKLIRPVEVPKDEVTIWSTDKYSIRATQTKHNAGCARAYALAENDRPGKLDVEQAKRLGVQPGPDMGRLKNGYAVKGYGGNMVEPDDAVGPPQPGRKVVITGDTAPCLNVQWLAHNADLLIHEATLLESDSERSLRTEHSTAKQAATIAVKAKAKRLALYHLPARHIARKVLKEAWGMFMGAVAPNDLDSIDLPLSN